MNYKTHLTKILFGSVVVLVFFQATLFLFFQKTTPSVQKEKILNQPFEENFSALPIHASYFSKKEFFDEAFQEGVLQMPLIEEKIFGAIVPHHLMVRDKIAAVFLALEKQSYKTVILIGPNHYNQGDAGVITSRARWETPYGVIDPDLALIDSLANDTIARIDEKPFEIEHSISSLISFVKKSFPKAKFVPIILKENLSRKDIAKLTNFFKEKIDPQNTLVLASVDFSHYQSVDVANFHDARSRSLIENFDFERIEDLEVDSPNALFVLLSYLEKNLAKKSQLLFHTNSGILVGNEDDPTTSHQIWIFSQGEKSKNEKMISVLFVGDVMLDRYVKSQIQKNGFDFLFEKIAGVENRFFRGIDIIGANLEGVVTQNGEHFPPQLENDFAFDVETVKNFRNYSFNFFNIANNHNLDQGRNGFEESQKQLKNLGFSFSGCPDGEVGECTDTIMTVGNIKIGMMGFSMIYQAFDLVKAVERVKNLKNITDVVIVNIHWGREYEHEYTKTQVSVAHALVDAGADAIIGHHPHVVQGMETYKEKPIFYSLGNFIFDQYFSEDTQEGLAVGINFFVPLNHGSTEKIKTNIKYEISLFPFTSQKSQAELMKDEKKKLFLDKFSEWSSFKNK